MNNLKNYNFDEKTHTWRKKIDQTIAYSDGARIERNLLKILKSTNDKSVFSKELQSKICDWPTSYHFSNSRHCAIRHLDIKSGDTVLELGCGCGAITRYLGEIGAQVTSVDGGFVRAQVAAERCRDLKNVRVIIDNLLLVDLEQKYDWVLFIGVLEYAPMFSNSKNPVSDYLQIAKSNLAVKGNLVIAIENKLGLKYLNGLAEDHVSLAYYGINNLYNDKTVVTFGKEELIDTLKKESFNHMNFYYPFPDYKLPRVVFSDKAIINEKFNVSELLLRIDAIDYTGSSQRNFSEALAFRELEKNKLLDHFANSFVVVASQGSIKKEERLAWHYSFGNRKMEYVTETHFQDNETEILVTKQQSPNQKQLNSNNIEPGKIIISQEHESFLTKYIEGRSLFWDILEMRFSSFSKNDISKSFLPWFKFIIEKYNIQVKKRQSIEDVLINGSLIDATPFNIIRTSKGIELIDKEWSTKGQITLGFLVFRSIYWCLIAIAPYGYMYFLRSIKVHDVMNQLCSEFGLVVNREDISMWQEKEAQLQIDITNAEKAFIFSKVKFKCSSPANYLQYSQSEKTYKRIVKSCLIYLSKLIDVKWIKYVIISKIIGT